MYTIYSGVYTSKSKGAEGTGEPTSNGDEGVGGN